MLFKFKSTLLKIIPELGFPGLMQSFAFLPLCNPTPVNVTGDFIVF